MSAPRRQSPAIEHLHFKPTLVERTMRKCCQILAMAKHSLTEFRFLRHRIAESAMRKYVKRTMTYRDRLLVKRTLTHWDRLLVNGIATLSAHTPALKENIKA